LSVEDLPDKIKLVSNNKQASGTKSLHNVYMPVQLFNRKVLALIDTGCDTSILGARLWPKGIQVQPKSYLLAANGTKIPLLSELKATFKVSDHEHAVLVAATEAVDDFILGINFLSIAANWTLAEVTYCWERTR